MHALPHHYRVNAAAAVEGDITTTADQLPSLAAAAPAEFDGPGDRWSPESLLVAAVVDCFVLSFRAIARASKLEWAAIECEATGTLDRVDRVTQFTAFSVKAKLRVPSGTSEERAGRLLEKAEKTCLITQSLKADAHLEYHVLTDS